MHTISRKLPTSHLQRKSALSNCKNKRDSNPPSGNILTNSTSAELTTQESAFSAQYNKVSAAQAKLSNYTPVKNDSRDKCKLMITNFIQAINIAVDQKVLTKGDRAYYGIEIESGNLLPMGNESEIKESASLIVEGDALRIADGGAEITLPKIKDVSDALDDFIKKLEEQSNRAEALDNEQEALNTLVITVDPFIKRLWAEIEARFAAEPIESRRSSAREWGVVYANVTHNIKVTVEVVDAVTKLPIADADATLAEAELEEVTDKSGVTNLFTSIEGQDELTVAAEGYEAAIRNINTADGEPLTVTIELQKAA